jgi:hypothetical protein
MDEELRAALARDADHRLTLVERRRGVYTVPINDGAGPLDGSYEFTRTFETPPIQHEAAAEIERLRSGIRNFLLGEYDGPLRRPPGERCHHGMKPYEICEECIDDHFLSVLGITLANLKE